VKSNVDAVPVPRRRASALAPRAESAPVRRVMWLKPDVLRELSEERMIRIEVNGCHAGTVRAIPDAPEELALGWALMHGFLHPDDVPERLTVDGDRVSIMIANGGDIDRRRLAAVGWIDDDESLSPPVGERPADPSMSSDELISLIDTCWTSFRHDDGGDGYHQAAVASATSVLCIARDRNVDLAIAKVMGWLLRDGRDTGASIVLARGMVGRHVIDASASLGLGMIVTSGVPTADACRAAQGSGMTVVGMATARTVGVLIDHGHVRPA